uniref:Uncharacterized protein n=1 Tax=Setaria digitata TaxID=48799 RepID=A0A915PHT7_9BILA
MKSKLDTESITTITRNKRESWYKANRMRNQEGMNADSSERDEEAVVTTDGHGIDQKVITGECFRELKAGFRRASEQQQDSEGRVAEWKVHRRQCKDEGYKKWKERCRSLMFRKRDWFGIEKGVSQRSSPREGTPRSTHPKIVLSNLPM